MSNLSKVQQWRTTSPNPASQKEALSVAGCAQVRNWRPEGAVAGAKVTVNSKNNGLHQFKVTASDKSTAHDIALAQGFLGGNWGLNVGTSSAKSLADVHRANVAKFPLGGGCAKNFAYPGHSAKHFAQFSTWWRAANLRVSTSDAQSTVRLTPKPIKPLLSLDCAAMEQLANRLIGLNSGEIPETDKLCDSPRLDEHEQYSCSIEYHSAEFSAQFNHNGKRAGLTAGGRAGTKKKGQVSPALDMLVCHCHAAVWHQISMSAGEWFLSQSFIAASMRVCQPRPVALNAAITSGEYLMLTCDFGSAFTGRPCLRIAFNSLKGMSLTSSPSSNRVSGSCATASLILRSSSSVGRMVPGLSFSIVFHLRFGGFPQADNAVNLFIACIVERKDHCINSVVEIGKTVGDTDVTVFSVVTVGIRFGSHSVPFKMFSIGQIYAMFLLVGLILNRVEYDFHAFIVATINKMSKGELLPGGAKEKGQHSALTLWICANVDHFPGVFDFLRPCRLRRTSNTLSGKYSGGLLSGSVGGCVSGLCAFAIPQLSGSDLDFLRSSALSLRPQASSTHAEKFALRLSAFSRSTLASISSISSCGKRIPFKLDLLLMFFVAIVFSPRWCVSTIHQKMRSKILDVLEHLKLWCVNTISTSKAQATHKIAKPGSAGTLTGPLTTNVTETNAMAKPQCNQTHPKFQYRFLALSATDSHVIHIIAPTEREAREQSPVACVMVFAGRLPVQEVKHV